MITVNGSSMVCPGYNEIISISEDTDVSGLNEPVTIQEHKDYIRTEGWSGETSDATEFSFDDDLIAELNTSARQYIEQVANVSLIPKSLQVVLTNMGGIELPLSPIDEVSAITELNGDAVDSDLIITVGNNQKRLKSPTGSDLTVSYTTSALKDQRPLSDIKVLVWWMYDNHTKNPAEAVKSVPLMISSYSRKNPIG